MKDLTKYVPTMVAMDKTTGALVFWNKKTRSYSPIGQVSSNVQVPTPKTVTLTAAQVNALNTTPVDLIPAPGAGKAIVITSVVAEYDYVTTAFGGVASGDDMRIKYNGGSTIATIETTGFIDQTSDQYRNYTVPAGELTIAPNTKVVVDSGGDGTTGGTGSTVKLIVTYKIISL